MDTETTEIEVAEPVSAPSVDPVSTPTAKPWIAAGFKSRDAWREYKATMAKANGETEAVVEKPAKPKAKAVVKVVAKAAKPKKPKKEKKVKAAKAVKTAKESTRTTAEKRAAQERTAAFKKALAKKEKPSEKEKKVFDAFGRKGATKTIAELGKEAFSSKPKVTQTSWVRNGLRYLVVAKLAKKIDRGTYERIG